MNGRRGSSDLAPRGPTTTRSVSTPQAGSNYACRTFSSLNIAGESAHRRFPWFHIIARWELPRFGPRTFPVAARHHYSPLIRYPRGEVAAWPSPHIPPEPPLLPFRPPLDNAWAASTPCTHRRQLHRPIRVYDCRFGLVGVVVVVVASLLACSALAASSARTLSPLSSSTVL